MQWPIQLQIGGRQFATWRRSGPKQAAALVALCCLLNAQLIALPTTINSSEDQLTNKTTNNNNNILTPTTNNNPNETYRNNNADKIVTYYRRMATKTGDVKLDVPNKLDNHFDDHKQLLDPMPPPKNVETVAKKQRQTEIENDADADADVDIDLAQPTTTESNNQIDFNDDLSVSHVLVPFIFGEFQTKNMTLYRMLETMVNEARQVGASTELLASQSGLDVARLPNQSGATSPSVAATAASTLAAVAASTPTSSRPFFGDFFYSFQVAYWPFHCITCLAICTVGIFANLTNIVVLTRPNMITAVNTILCAIACSDLIVNLVNIPYLIHLLSDSSNTTAYFSYNWAVYTFVYANVTLTAHTISIWLTCVLATWRYFVIRSESPSQRNWSVGLAVRVIIGVILFVPVFCIPSYLTFDILSEQTGNNHTIYRVGFSKMAENSQIIKTFQFWMYSGLTKLLPCFMLTFFTTVLVRKMLDARERRLRLTQGGDKAFQEARKSLDNTNAQISKLTVNSTSANATRNIIPNGGQILVSSSRDLAETNQQDQTKAFVNLQPSDTAETKIGNGLLVVVQVGTDSSRRSNNQSPDEQLIQVPGNLNGGQLKILDRQDSLKMLANEMVDQEATDYEQEAARSQNFGQLAHQNVATITNPLNVQTSCSVGSSNSICLQNTAKPQVYGNLLVESAMASNPNGTHNKTTLITSSPSSLEQTRNDNSFCGTDSSAIINSCHHSDRNGDSNGRSSSTCGALELCATLNNNGASETSCRLVSSIPQASGKSDQQYSPPRSDRAASAQEFARDIQLNSDHDRRLTRSSLSQSNLPIDLESRTTTAQNGNHLGSNVNNVRTRSIGNASPHPVAKPSLSQRQMNQNETITRLLIAVMILFIICEFPAGILAALCAIFGPEFFDNVYQPMGALTDLFALINSSVNFVLYCLMSTQFRQTFYSVVLRCPATNVRKPK